MSKASRCASRGGAAAGIAAREGLRSANLSSVCDKEGLVKLCDAANGSTSLVRVRARVRVSVRARVRVRPIPNPDANLSPDPDKVNAHDTINRTANFSV